LRNKYPGVTSQELEARHEALTERLQGYAEAGAVEPPPAGVVPGETGAAVPTRPPGELPQAQAGAVTPPQIVQQTRNIARSQPRRLKALDDDALEEAWRSAQRECDLV
jgi:hypothetical protein